MDEQRWEDVWEIKWGSTSEQTERSKKVWGRGDVCSAFILRQPAQERAVSQHFWISEHILSVFLNNLSAQEETKGSHLNSVYRDDWQECMGSYTEWYESHMSLKMHLDRIRIKDWCFWTTTSHHWFNKSLEMYWGTWMLFFQKIFFQLMMVVESAI